MAAGDLASLLPFRRHDDGCDDIPEPELQDAVPDDGPVLVPVPLRGTQMTYGRQVAEALAHAIRESKRKWREEQRREGSYASRARAASWSIDDDFDYAARRCWVPPGHDGGIAEKTGVLYWALIGRPGVVYAAWTRWKFSRMYRWLIWAAVRFAVAMAVLTMLGHGALARWISIAVGAVLAIGAAVLMPRRSEIGAPGTGDDQEEEDPE